ncbi:MAG: KH domain-containing protein [Deltaproteobacteria bacterium]|nr:KH domain-containing protein [Deltaproteobacteria bacterium]
MEHLVSFLSRGLVAHPEEVYTNVVEGETVLIVELQVHDDDVARVNGPGGRNIRAMRQVLSAASGRKKAVLEIVNAHAARDEEE